MTIEDRPFDPALFLHESQAPHDDPDMVEPCGTDDNPTDDTAAQRAHKTALRRSQGDRTDWKTYLDHIPGTRLIPDELLSIGTKQRRTLSIRSALERRDQRRASGIPIHYTHIAFKRLSPEKREALASSKHGLAVRLMDVGGRFQPDADFYWFNTPEDAAEHLSHLYRSGTAKARPRQTIEEYRAETQIC